MMRGPFWGRWPWIAIVVIAALVIGIDLTSPVWVKRTLNGKLDTMGAFNGHVRGVSLHLWRGAYSIDELLIEGRAGKSSIPLLHAPRMDLALSWNALLRGAKDQFATRIEIHGETGDRKISTWQSIMAVLHNAFAEAFRPQFGNLPNRRAGDKDD